MWLTKNDRSLEGCVFLWTARRNTSYFVTVFVCVLIHGTIHNCVLKTMKIDKYNTTSYTTNIYLLYVENDWNKYK